MQASTTAATPHPTTAEPATTRAPGRGRTGCNATVLAGTLSSDARTSVLASGSVLVRLEVTTPGTDGGRADSVPVAWFDPPTSGPALRAGDRVLVVGRVRRRWFSAVGGARSVTEVVASSVIPATRRAAARRALDALTEELRGLAPS